MGQRSLSTFVTLALCANVTNARRLWSHRAWLTRYGQPLMLEPAAFCDKHGVTIAVPITGDCAEIDPTSVAWGSLVSVRQVQLGPRGSDCAARFEPGFFRRESNGTVVDAWLARATHSGCQGHSVYTDDSIIHSNRWTISWSNRTGIQKSPEAEPNLNVLVSCTCSIETEECNANARWEQNVLSRIHSSDGSDSLIGGYSSNSAAIVGPAADVDVLPDHER